MRQHKTNNCHNVSRFVFCFVLVVFVLLFCISVFSSARRLGLGIGTGFLSFLYVFINYNPVFIG